LPVDETNARRYAAGAAVVVLHVVFVAALIAALNSHSGLRQVAREIQLLLLKPPPPTKTEILPPPEPLPPMRFPALEAPEPEVPLPSSPSSLSAIPVPPAVTGVGKALFGCNPETRLGTEEREQCPHGQFGAPHEQSVGLGPPPDPDSPWAKAVAERNTQPRPINQPCPLGSYQDTRGLPCFSFDQKAPVLDALH
jgi:hypothetical protein